MWQPPKQRTLYELLNTFQLEVLFPRRVFYAMDYNKSHILKPKYSTITFNDII